MSFKCQIGFTELLLKIFFLPLTPSVRHLVFMLMMENWDICGNAL